MLYQRRELEVINQRVEREEGAQEISGGGVRCCV